MNVYFDQIIDTIIHDDGTAEFIYMKGSHEKLSKEEADRLLRKVLSTDVDNKIFDQVEIEPSFPGGEEAWNFYLAKNLNLNRASLNDAPQDRYTVVVKFVVDIEGKASDFKTLTSHGFGMEEEAIRIVKSVRQWNPAIQNGHKVKAYKKQKITFSTIKNSNHSNPVQNSSMETWETSVSVKKESVFFYFCLSHSKYSTSVKEKQFIIYTNIDEFTGDENKLREISRKWGEYVRLNCENNIGCTSDLNYYKSKEQADMQLEIVKKRYSDPEKFILKKVELN